MSKAVMLSLQPKWCELIASGRKTIEVRKTRPSIETPFKVYIYQTKKKWIYRLLEKLGLYQRKVIGEFVCDKIDKIMPRLLDDANEIGGYIYYFTYLDNYLIDGKSVGEEVLNNMCLTGEELCDYGNGATLYGWHVSDLVIYDKPRELREFKREIGRDEHVIAFAKLTRPPQSWCYVEEV